MTEGGVARSVPSAELVAVLEESRRLGFLGPGPVQDHVAHSRALAEFVGDFEGPALDLGAGGGVPGLVLAATWPDQEIALLDAMHRRCQFLERAVVELGFGDRVRVLEGRAEDLARDDTEREHYGLVVARSFGPPAATAESAAGFLRAGGRLIVSEPPDVRSERWAAEGLARLDLLRVRTGRIADAGFVEIRLQGRPSAQWPRRTGIPWKRPLW